MKPLFIFAIFRTLYAEITEGDFHAQQDFPALALAKLEDRITYLKNLAYSRVGRQLATDNSKPVVGNNLGNVVQAKEQTIWGFGWENGKFIRCQHPQHVAVFMQMRNGEPSMRLNLFDRSSERPPKKSQMKCMLYLRLNKVTRSSSRIHEVVFEFKSNCKNTRIFKIFGNYSVDAYDEVMRNLKVQFFGTTFDVYFGRGNGPNIESQSVQNGSLVKRKKYLYTTNYYQKPVYKYKPEDLFYNMTYYRNQTEFANFTDIDKKIETMYNQPNRFKWAQWLPINESFEFLPKTSDNPYFDYDQIETIWNNKNPQDCPIRYEAYPSNKWMWDYGSRGMVMECQVS